MDKKREKIGANSSPVCTRTVSEGWIFLESIHECVRQSGRKGKQQRDIKDSNSRGT